MPLIPYSIARPLLFRLDPEAAHDLTLSMLAGGQGTPLQCGWSSSLVHDPLTLAGLHFPNRVGLAAGLDKNARCVDALDAMGFGFVEVGTVTPLPQAGNPKPRMFRLPAAKALINRLGFNNDGLEVFIRNVRQAKCRRPDQRTPMLLGLNIGKNASTPMDRATDDYLAGLSGVYAHADYVTINISSPNTQNLRALQSDAALDALLSAIAERREELAAQHDSRRVPIFVKIAPDLDDTQINAIARSLTHNQMDGVIATNTTIARSAVLGLAHGGETGGLSGQPVFEASNAVIRKLRAALGPHFPIVGVGGILSERDAVEKIRAGADVVQIYTGLIYEGPELVNRCARALQQMAR